MRVTTLEQIVKMVRDASGKRVYLSSHASEICFSNVYGIDIPSTNQLIAYSQEVDKSRQIISADGLIFQNLATIIEIVTKKHGYRPVRMLDIR